MKFHLQKQTGQFLFTGHGAGHIMINGVRYEKSVAVTADCVFENWRVGDIASLNAEHIEFLRALNPEIVLLGTGAAMRFPPRELSRSLVAQRIGFEVMDTPAACRTYNILIAEGRNVVAAILPA
jgi:uncharacterized protein